MRSSFSTSGSPSGKGNFSILLKYRSIEKMTPMVETVAGRGRKVEETPR